jgi:hypothetical protein
MLAPETEGTPMQVHVCYICGKAIMPDEEPRKVLRRMLEYAHKQCAIEDEEKKRSYSLPYR